MSSGTTPLAWLCLLALLLAHARARADDGAAWLTGSVRGAWWSGSRQLDDRRDVAVGALWLKAEPSFGPAWSATAQGWARHDGRAHAALREAFVQYASGPTTVRLGRQLIVWGRADQINPTDNLSPRDFTLPVPDSSDERLGATGVSVARQLGDYSLSAVWLPRFKSNTVPWPSGLSVAEVKPHGHRQVGLKLDHSAPSGVDWSVSWYSGFDLNPSLRPAPARLDAVHPRTDVAGLDFAVPVGAFGLRGELAYTHVEQLPGALTKRPFAFGVFGIERTFGGTLNVNLQAFAYRVAGYRDPRGSAPDMRPLAIAQAVASHQLDRWERGLTLRVADKWFNETLEGEFVVVSTWGRAGSLLRPRLAYAVDDHLRLTVGADVYRGAADSFYGRLRQNSAAMAELRYGW